MQAAGRWAWWNEYGSASIPTCVHRAREARLRGVIVKWGYHEARAAFERAGIPWATERYVYPDQPEIEARRLAEDIERGARFAVINAEVEWEPLGPEPMRRLIGEFRRVQPDAELYASVDTRGGRTALPYQRVLAEHIAGWMPMVYPKAFGQPVHEALAASLTPLGATGPPALPTIQTYDNIGANAVREQMAELRSRGLPGYQVYTIAHATDAEWAAVVEDAANEEAVEMQPYLAQERGSPYVWIVWGNTRSYLRDFAHAEALGIAAEVRTLPAGTLSSLGRVE